MFVCLCTGHQSGVSDWSPGCLDVAADRRSCGAARTCGRCRRTVRSIIEASVIEDARTTPLVDQAAFERIRGGRRT